MLRQSKDREKMCNCMVLDVTAIFFWITAFLKKLPFLAKGLLGTTLQPQGKEPGHRDTTKNHGRLGGIR